MSAAIAALAGALTDEESEASCTARRKAPRRPWGLERSWWHRQSRTARRQHYRCCWLPAAAFALEDCERGRGTDWWMKDAAP